MRTVIRALLAVVVVLGLLVGFAHWRLATQTPEGSWEFDVGEIEGAIHLSGTPSSSTTRSALRAG